MKKHLLLLLFIFTGGIKALAQPNCAAGPTGFTPINDLGTGTFTTAWNATWQGGLYPNGSNTMPASHQAAGLQLASQVQCLNTAGNPDAVNGKVVWLSIGMSNTTQETQKFIPLANALPAKNPKLVLVDGAQGGQSASVISAPWNSGYLNFWNTVNNRLTNAGVSANQVQVIWLKEADQATKYSGVKGYYDSLEVMFPRILHEIKNRFPNVKLCYVASRISARYATSNLNPEPHSYYTGWAVKNLIEKQINGDPNLKYAGPNAKAPWLSWGIYMWSDGSTPQLTNPQIAMSCPTDFQNDGTHPSAAGAQKVAGWLLDFFTSDPTATPWFLGFGCPAVSGLSGYNSNSNTVSIYPNPAQRSFNIEFVQDMVDSEIILYDALGRQKLHLHNQNGRRIQIDTRHNLSPRLHLIKVLDKKKQIFSGTVLIK